MYRKVVVPSLVAVSFLLPGAAHASFDEWVVHTPGSTGMMGEYVYDVLYDDVTGQVVIAADDPIWDEGGFALTTDALTWDTHSNVNGDAPTHFVENLTYDENGDLWMSSGVGLLRYDGVSTEIVWSAANAPWPHSGVSDFDWDSEGNLWVALAEVNTTRGGVAKWDGTTWTVTHTGSGLPWTKGWDSVVTLDVDATDRVWVGSDTMGAAMYDGAAWTWFQPTFGGLAGSWVRDLLVEDDGTAWFATMGGGVSRFDGAAWSTWDRYNGPFGTQDISLLALDNEGDVWLATFIGTLWEFDGVGWDGQMVPLGHIYGLDFDALNRPIAGGINGLVMGDGSLYAPWAVSLSNRWVHDIHVASDGKVWAGGGGGGVTSYDGATWRSYNPVNDGVYPWPFATDGVEDVVEGHDGHVFVNAMNHGVGEWDGSAWTAHLAGQTVEALAVAPDGALWAGPVNGEIARYDGAAWTIVNAPRLNELYAMEVDPAGDVWLGTITGLHRWDGAAWTTYLAAGSELPNDIVFALKAEPDGSGIWVGTFDGLAFFDGVAGWTQYDMTNSGVPADHITALEIAPDGALWVGAFDGANWPYDGGAARFDGATWRTFTEESSAIPHEEVYSIAVDAEGNAWIGTASEGIGVLLVGEPEIPFHPSAYAVQKGAWLQGDAAKLAVSDDDGLWVDGVLSGKSWVSTTLLTATSPVQVPVGMGLAVEVGSDGRMEVTVAVRNHVTGRFDVLGAERLDVADELVSFTVPDPAAHVGAGGLVEVRLTAVAPSKVNPTGAAAGVDYLRLDVAP